VPLAEKQPQSIMFPPPCLTVGMVSYSAFFPLQTRQVELMPKSLILVSSRAGVGPLFSPGISGPRPAHFFHGSGNWINEATVQLLLSCSFFLLIPWFNK